LKLIVIRVYIRGLVNPSDTIQRGQARICSGPCNWKPFSKAWN